VRGAFNVAAEPVIDAAALGRLLHARPIPIPPRAARWVLDAGWRLHAVPASPWLLELALSLPVMDTSRATNELGWKPAIASIDAIDEMLHGMREHAGGETAPLRAGRLSEWRAEDLVGSRAPGMPGATSE
jgi:UDP-glucose 4-epimerase